MFLLCSFQRTKMVGLSRLELLTSRLSGVRSNQLSYRPILGANARSLRLTVSCHQILRSTYLWVRLPWICCHSLLSIKAFASLSTTYIGLHPIRKKDGGDEENRTPDPLLARQVLSQLSYAPILWWMLPSKLDNAKRSQMTDLRLWTVGSS